MTITTAYDTVTYKSPRGDIERPADLVVARLTGADGAAVASASNPVPTILYDANGVAVSYVGGYTSSVTLTRTSDTNIYAANDVVGAATGSTAALTFANVGPSGGEIVIDGCSLEIDATGVISGETSYTLHFYNVTPPSALGDNAAFDLPSGDRASYLGSINLGTPVDLGSTLYIAFDGFIKRLKLSGTSLFAYLVTVGTYTPTSARVHVITLHSSVV